MCKVIHIQLRCGHKVICVRSRCLGHCARHNRLGRRIAACESKSILTIESTSACDCEERPGWGLAVKRQYGGKSVLRDFKDKELGRARRPARHPKRKGSLLREEVRPGDVIEYASWV